VSSFRVKPEILQRLPANGHVIIEASAGTGKTHTIEHIVADLLLRGECSIDQLLIVTFTVRATHELRIRIRRLLESLLNESNGVEPSSLAPSVATWCIDEQARENIRKALGQFDTATIRTIHAFCQKVLQEHAFACARPLQMELVERRRVFGRAFHQTLREQIAPHPVLAPLLAAVLHEHGMKQLQDGLERVLAQRGQVEPSFDLGDAAPEQTPLPLRFIEAAESARALLNDPQSDYFIRRFKDLPFTPGNSKAARESLEQAVPILRHFNRQRWGEALRSLQRLELHLVAQPPLTRDVAWTTFSLQFRQAFATLAAARFDLFAAALAHFAPLLRRQIQELKLSQGWTDHDELIEAVYEALASERGELLSAALRRRYRVALIDEFQDTDELQWEIFRRLFVDSGSSEHRLFVIGDPKQAIYGFRGGDVYTYLNARKRLSNASLRLQTNYRSSPAMVECCNTLFSSSDADGYFSGPIKGEAGLAAGRKGLRLLTPDGDEQAALLLQRLVGERLSSHRLEEQCADGWAQLIRELLQHEYWIADADSDTRRRLCARDIFLLTRTNAEAQRLAGVLREAEIAFTFFKEDGLFQSDEARDVYDLLRAVWKPDDHRARLRAWQSPFFALRVEELGRCAELSPEHPLLARLSAWHQLAREQRFAKLFSSIIDESGLVRRELLLSKSQRALINYNHIFELLLGELQSSWGSLEVLLAHLSAFIEQRESPPGMDGNVQRIDSERDAVQIMTIHKSKGLEAAVVLLCGGFSPHPESVPFVFHRGPSDEATRVVALQKPAAEADQQALQHEQEQEKQRLYYVAATRAKLLLGVPFYDPMSVSANQRSRLKAGDFEVLRWRIHRLLERETSQHSDTHSPASQQKLLRLGKHSVWQGSQNPGQAKRAEPEQAQLSEALLHPTPRGNLTPPQSTLLISSYSRIKQRQSQGAASEELRRVLPHWQEEGELPPGAAAGNALHRVLELMDFERTRALGFEAWCDEPENTATIDQSLLRFDLPMHCRAHVQRIVYSLLARPIALGEEQMPGLAWAQQHRRELEFFFPIPEAAHPAWDRSWYAHFPEGQTLKLSRGWIKGYIDLVFEWNERLFFVDYKSDTLPSYAPEALRAHVEAHYAWQQKLYTLALLRAVHLHDEDSYTQRFGGVVYSFLRGMPLGREPHEGFYHHKPSWEQVLAFGEQLERTQAL
jgi:exodeoxyribonuclease V beta subunit